MASPKAPAGFEVLSDTISIARPNPEIHLDDDSPSLLVICSWMAALPKHIQKYTDQYKKLFPSTTILLVQSTWKDVAGTDEFMVSRLALAVSIIKEHISVPLVNIPSNGQRSNKIFLHIFSNGGATIATQLSLQLHAALLYLSSLQAAKPSQPPRRRLFSRFIFECTPSRPYTSQAVKAVSASALPRNYLLRIIGTLLIRCFVSYGFFKCWLLGRENMVDRLRRRLNSPIISLSSKQDVKSRAVEQSAPQVEGKRDGSREEIWDPEVPRLYMYSRADEVVGWRDVHDHALHAREVGFAVVREEVFEKAPHVGLPREDFERYWGIVEGWWREAN